MNAFWKDIFREITHTKARFVSLILITALGAMTLVGIQASAINMRDVADSTYREQRLFDLHLRSTTGFNEDDLTAIYDTDGVATVMAAHSVDVYATFAGEQSTMRTFSLPDSLNLITLTQGRLPENDSEIVVEQRVLDDSDYHIGDRLTLRLENMEQFDHTFANNEFTIVGVVSSPLFLTNERGRTTLGNGIIRHYAYLHPDAYVLDVFTDVYIEMEGAREIFSLSQAYDNMAQEWKAQLMTVGDRRLDARALEIEHADERREEIRSEMGELQGQIAAFEENIALAQAPLFEEEIQENLQTMNAFEAQFAELEAAYMQAAITAYTPLPEWHYFTRQDGVAFDAYFQDTLRLEQIGYVFPIVFFLVAILVTLTSMSRMIEEQRSQMGTYKALGFHSSSIVLKYSLYAFISGSLGGLLGIAIGSQVFPRIIVGAYQHLYNLPPISTPVPLTISIFALLASVFSVLSITIITCMKTTSGTPAELLRPKAPKPGKRVLLERIPFLWKRMGFMEKVTARNIFRYKRRFFMTLTGVAGCTALLVTAFAMRSSLNSVADLQFDEILRYDTVAYLQEIREPRQREALDVLIADETRMYSRQEATTVSTTHGQISASIIVPENPETLHYFIRLLNMDGAWITIADYGVLLSEKLAHDLGLSPGDSAELSMDGGAVYTVFVQDVVENYVFHFVYMSPLYYSEIFDANPYPNTLLIHGDVDLDMLSDIAYVRMLAEMSERKRNVSDSTDALGIVTILILLASCALSFIVLFNLTIINLAERRREMATIKVLGFQDNETSMYIGRESLMVTVLGIAMGLVIGYYLSGFVIASIEVNIIRFPREIGFMSFVYAATLSFLFALFVNFVTHWKIAAIDMVESLKSVE